MLAQIAFFPILNLPLIAWGGLGTFLLLILAAYIGWQNSKGVNNPPLITLRAHKILALLALISGLGHGLLGLLTYLGF